jgi:hypothetical protein
MEAQNTIPVRPNLRRAAIDSSGDPKTSLPSERQGFRATLSVLEFRS